MAHMVDMAVHLKTGGVLSASDYLTKTMSEQKGGSGSVTVLRSDGTQLPGSPFKGGGLPGPWAVVVDGNDNVWVSNFATPASPIVQLCGVRTENCPPGFKTGDQISPPGGYVGGGLQLQTDIAVGPAGRRLGHQQLAGHRQLLRRCGRGAVDALRQPGRGDLCRHGRSRRCARRRSARHGRCNRHFPGRTAAGNSFNAPEESMIKPTTTPGRAAAALAALLAASPPSPK